MNGLKVKGRWLTWDDGEPFFYLGDTAWELFHNLSREEIVYYFDVRAKQGFNVAQCVALSEWDGLSKPNCYGRLPLLCTNGEYDPTKPDIDGEYSYWDHVDFAVKVAEEHEMFIALLPTWGDKFNLCWGKGPVIFNEKNAYTYGKWIAERYKECRNIIWVLGGDRPLEEKHRKIIDAMAKGIREVDRGHLITFHPSGTSASTDFVSDADYIDFHTAQSGHGVEICYDSDKLMLKMADAEDKPYMDSEPRYEDSHACFDAGIGYCWNADDVRQNAYWNMMTGVCGHTYGNHNVWGMNRDTAGHFPLVWQEALTRDGAEQMRYLKALRMSRDYFSLHHAPELLSENFDGMGHMTAAKGNGYAYIYSPLGAPFTLKLDIFEDAASIRAIWFDPRKGSENVFTILPANGSTLIVPPSAGKGNDWVLVLEAVTKG